MEQTSNPGGATPEVLYRLYKGRAAVVGNPCVLRDIQQQGTTMHFASLGSAEQAQERRDEREALLQRQAVMAPMQSVAGLTQAHAIPRTCATYATCTPRYGGGASSPAANTAAFKQIGRSAPATRDPNSHPPAHKRPFVDFQRAHNVRESEHA